MSLSPIQAVYPSRYSALMLYRRSCTSVVFLFASDETSFEEITCFCGKPYMGRPMIECSQCFNWLHLRCVRLRKSNIPETYVCESCKGGSASPPPVSSKTSSSTDKKRPSYTKKRKSPSAKDSPPVDLKAQVSSVPDQRIQNASNLTFSTATPDTVNVANSALKLEGSSSPRALDNTTLPGNNASLHPSMPFFNGLGAPPRFTSAPPVVNNNSSMLGAPSIHLQKPLAAASHLCTTEFEKFVQGKYFSAQSNKSLKPSSISDTTASVSQ